MDQVEGYMRAKRSHAKGRKEEVYRRQWQRDPALRGYFMRGLQPWKHREEVPPDERIDIVNLSEVTDYDDRACLWLLEDEYTFSMFVVCEICAEQEDNAMRKAEEEDGPDHNYQYIPDGVTMLIRPPATQPPGWKQWFHWKTKGDAQYYGAMEVL